MEQVRKAMNDKPWLRWGVLFLTGFVLSVNYYFYDAFSTLKDLLVKEFGFTNTDYGLFVSFYSIPNTFLFMAVIGGIILDKVGIRKTGFTFVFFMAFGAVLTAYGATDYYREGGVGYGIMSSFWTGYSPELKMMLLGRFFYGLGAETSIVVVSKILVKWFKGRDLALAFGLKVGFGRLGTALALNLSPIIADGGAKLSTAIWFAAVLVLAGLLAFMVYMLMDLKLDRQLALVEEKKIAEKFQFRDIIKLLTNPAYVLIALLCVTFYSAVFPFNAFAPDLLLHKFGMSEVESGRFTSLMPIATLIFTPIFGLFIDKRGRAATLMIFGSLALLLVHLSFAYTYIPPFIPMILLGIAFSLIPATMWPSMVKLVDDKIIGTAYGLMYSIQNLGLFLFPILAGIILDVSNPDNPETLDYTATMTMFVILSAFGLLFAIMLKNQDSKHGFGVELPLNQR